MTTSSRIFLLVCAAASLLYAGQVQTVTIPGSAMSKSLRARVVVPESYKKTKKRYPVVYLLHGYSNDYTTWSKISPLDKLSDTYETILVCPDGGFSSWYIDSPVKSDSRFGTYLSHDVVTYIDNFFRTWNEKNGRAVVGSSMGGHGALHIVSRNPERFRGAGSISGIMDLTEFTGKWDLPNVLGDFETNRETWKSFSALESLKMLRGKECAIVLDCGTSDFAIAGNRKAHAILLDMGIPHEYYERPGSHTWQYPQRVLESHLLFFSKLLKPAR